MDTFSIRANSLGRIFEDNDGNIWTLVDIGGIAKYDRVTSRFCYFTYDSNDPGNTNNIVLSAHFDSKNRGWIGTRIGINLINKDRLRFEPVTIEGHDEVIVTGIYHDKNETVWVGSNKGLFRYDELQNRFAEVKSVDDTSIIGTSKFKEDHDGNIWFSSFRFGLYHAKLSNTTEIKKASLPGEEKPFIMSLFQTQTSGINVLIRGQGIFELSPTGWKAIPFEGIKPNLLRFAYSSEKNDEVFILTFDNHVFLYNHKTGTTRSVNNFQQPINGFTLDEDDANLWLGSMNFGLYQVSIEKPDFEAIYINKERADQQDYSNFITNLHGTEDRKFYIASNSGLIEFDQNTSEQTTVIPYWGEHRFPHFITSMQDYNAETLLLGTEKGIYKFHRNTRSVKPFVPINERVNDFQIRNDSIWAIGSFGVFVHDIQRDSTTYLHQIEDAPQVLKEYMSRKIFIDNSGIVWVGTVREGLFRIEPTPSSFKFNRYMYHGIRKSGFLSQSINAIFEDSAGRLWIGAFSSGLLEFDRESRKFYNYTPNGTLPVPNVQAIEEATDGCIWLSAADGIHKFIYKDKSFKRYTTKNGLSSNSFVLRSSTNLEDGRLLFGSNRGITIFDPVRISQEPKAPSVTLEKIKVFNTSKTFDRPIYDLESIELKYNQNFLTLDFTALDFNNAALISYAYQLKGLNDEWVNIGYNRTINLNNLRPGTYDLNIKAALNDGNWGGPKTLTITVTPPFWSTPWFFILFTLVILLVLWSIHYYRLQLKMRRIHFMEKVRKKAAADFHDEMGNKLTRIALFTDVLKKKLNGTTPEITEYVDKIRDNSRNLNSSMRDFLWALDPKKDTVLDVAVLLKDFGEELFDKTSIDFSVDCIDPDLERYKLDMDWKRNLIMIFKEAMHNVLKHANATRASLSFRLRQDQLVVGLADDGQGIQALESNDGYGMKNMSYRAQELRGHLEIDPNHPGTYVKFTGNLKSFSLT